MWFKFLRTPVNKFLQRLYFVPLWDTLDWEYVAQRRSIVLDILLFYSLADIRRITQFKKTERKIAI